MKKLCCVLVTAAVAAACGNQTPETPAPAANAFTPMPYANLAQVMQAIPFPNSNIIFDAGSEDPEAKRKAPESGGSAAGASAQYGNVYAGWQQVENSALALQETVNLIMIPGRMCQNGKPVPNDQDDFKKFAAGLADAGKAALDAAKSKDLDKMLEAGGTVTEACSACHEVYRDTPNQPADRCMPHAATAAP
jgi:hypothetical protein